jgi:hypothetical protein
MALALHISGNWARASGLLHSETKVDGQSIGAAQKRIDVLRPKNVEQMGIRVWPA